MDPHGMSGFLNRVTSNSDYIRKMAKSTALGALPWWKTVDHVHTYRHHKITHPLLHGIAMKQKQFQSTDPHGSSKFCISLSKLTTNSLIIFMAIDTLQKSQSNHFVELWYKNMASKHRSLLIHMIFICGATPNSPPNHLSHLWLQMAPQRSQIHHFHHDPKPPTQLVGESIPAF